jgi:predicted MPP superfamily phosphohydrolase
MDRVLRYAIFFCVLLLLIGSLHYYLWARLIRDTMLPLRWARTLTVVLIALAASIPGGMILGRLFPRAASPLSWIAFTWMGGVFLFFVSLVTADLARGAVDLVGWAGGTPTDPDRRLFLARAVGGIASVAALSGTGLALASALSRVQVREVTVRLSKWPRALDGFSIVQISDVHLGPTIGGGFLDYVVKRINSLAPDLVAVVGDLVDGSVEELAPAAKALGELQSKHGTYFVTGNHEYYSGADEWIAHLRSLGVKVLRNERVAVGDGEARFELAGTDDLSAHNFPGHGQDLERALSGRDQNLSLVLLAHQPRTFFESSKRGVDLQLSGHTHGGQIWPFGFLVKLQQGFLAGLDRVGSSQLYTSRGTGYWGPPMRLFAPAEITRLILRPEA